MNDDHLHLRDSKFGNTQQKVRILSSFREIRALLLFSSSWAADLNCNRCCLLGLFLKKIKNVLKRCVCVSKKIYERKKKITSFSLKIRIKLNYL